MAEHRGYMVGPVLADKIVSAVKRIGDIPHRYGNASIPTRFEDGGGGGGGGGSQNFRICTFTGTWAKTTQKTVTFKYETNTPNTVSVTNLFCDITVDCGTRDCAIAQEGETWFLIAGEC